MVNPYEAKAREAKAHKIAGALVAEAARRGASIINTVLPVVELYAAGEKKDAAAQTGKFLVSQYGVAAPPSVITWARVAEILQEMDAHVTV